MPQREELEKLTSAELHDRAVELARRRLDLKFLWGLLRAVPSAEAAAGHLDYAEQDVTRVSGLLTDLSRAGAGEVAEQLRPMYLDYLEEHDDG